MKKSWVFLNACFFAFMTANLSNCKTNQVHKVEINLTNYYDEDIYVVGKTSFLEYMLKLKDMQTKINDNPNFTQACSQKEYAFTLYNEVVYSYSCHNVQGIETLKYKREELFVSNDNQDEVSRAFNVIKEYMAIRRKFKHQLNSQSTFGNNSKQLRFHEVIIEDMPFCVPYTCYYWNNDLYPNMHSLNLYQCMPTSCRNWFWGVILIDALNALIIILANLIIMIVIAKTHLLKSPHGRFSLSLAAADFIVGAVTEPCIIYNFVVKYKYPLSYSKEYNAIYVKISGFFTALSLCASLLTLICTSLFRYYAVIRPRTYWKNRRKVTQKAIQTILIIWLISALLGLFPIFGFIPDDYYFVHPVGLTLSFQMDNHYIYVATLCVGLFVIWTFTFGSCIAMHYKAMRKRISLPTSSDSTPLPTLTKASTRYRKLELTFNATLRLVVLAFTLSYLPLAVTQCFSKSNRINLQSHPDSFNSNTNTAWNIAMFFSSRLILANSFVNCIIYNVKNKEFLKAAKRIFKPKIQKSHR